MRFRDKGNMIQCIRTTYDSDKGRGVDKLIGSLPGDSSWAPDELTELLEDEEKQALNSLLMDRHFARNREAQRVSLVGLAGTVKLARAALSGADNVELLGPKETEELWLELDEMRRALRAAGRPKPKPEADVNM
jgi:hypothetical protein